MANAGVGDAPTRSIGWPLYLAFCGVGLTFVLAWLGPGSSDGLSFPALMLFWALHVFSSLSFLAMCQLGVGRISVLNRLPAVAQVVAAGVAATAIFTPFALAIDWAFGDVIEEDDLQEFWLAEILLEFAQVSVPLVLFWLLINTPSLVTLGRLGASAPSEALAVGPPAQEALAPEPDAAPENADAADFWSRIPKRLGRDIVAMSAELHYLRVRTTQGDTLILFAFGRAVALFGENEGMQIHRSHWISLSHVDEITANGEKVECRMIDGATLPVSRKYRKALRAAVKQA